MTTTNGDGADEESQRLVTWKVPIVDQRRIAALSGLECLQHLLHTRRQPPIAALMGFQLRTDLQSGRQLGASHLSH